jgi:UrcA family protein
MCTQLKSIAFAAALSALTGAAAHAETVPFDSLTESVSVSYADLDLNSAAGMKTLTVRITNAAKTVCGPSPEYRESHTLYEACIKSAVDHAMIEVAARAEANRLVMNSPHRHGG